MSTNNSLPSISILPPPGTTWIAAIGPAVNFLMIGATLGAAEIVMLCALLFFSTPSLRRSFIFLLNLFAILLGIAGTVVNCYEEIHSLMSPTSPVHPSVILTMGILTGIGPTYLDCMLLVRLHAVYSGRRVARRALFVILGIPITLNVGRAVNSIVYLVNFWNNMQKLVKGPSGLDGGYVIVSSQLPSVKIEWFAQIFADCYSSVLFLYPLYKSNALYKAGTSFSRKIVTLFWISVTNFVFPVILSITQLVVYMVIPTRFDIVLYIQEVNYHITIIAVVFATVWVFEGRWAQQHGIAISNASEESSSVSSIHFIDPGLKINGRFNVDGTRVVRPERISVATSNQNFTADTMDGTSIGGSMSTSAFALEGLTEYREVKEEQKSLA
ncbi:hypothetical protein EIP91_002670 [Steccherinum ochraceum]|uniref:G-protein coupled receptors family 1 profile domain-containing protein n=1 Tax=Steccherinum ochraceum TaxID=92696 RepID=A0A4R0REB7_9APHY|nr:hypothetical protein EIP91_002670 [Steccherinum ochraceum]